MVTKHNQSLITQIFIDKIYDTVVKLKSCRIINYNM